VWERVQEDPDSRTRGKLEKFSENLEIYSFLLPPCSSVKPSESHVYVPS
jgi:hypothetical protein